MPRLRCLWLSLVDALYPEHCLVCDRPVPARPPGTLVRGLRSWDRPHCCTECLEALAAEGPLQDRRGELTIWAGAPTGERLVSLISGWKYRGLRGAAWPVAELTLPALGLARAELGEEALLVPVAMHAGRRRGRGFDQADVLARLLASASECGSDGTVLRRRRATEQQARIGATDRGRRENVRDAFLAVAAPAEAAPVLLVDDLVTSGETAAAAAAALRRSGWRVDGVVAAGLSLASA